MKKLLVLLFSFSILIAPTIKAETVLYCTSELITGFIKDNDSWRLANFNETRHTVKFNHDYSRLEGLTEKPMECTVSYSFFPERIFCVHTWGSHETFTFNNATNRFVYSNPSAGGYTVNDSNPDTEVFSAGTCKVF